jgi:hypothetical protein
LRSESLRISARIIASGAVLQFLIRRTAPPRVAILWLISGLLFDLQGLRTELIAKSKS